MKIEDFIENFANQLEDTDITDLTSETNFHELDEWSSLSVLSILAMLDEEYDIQLKADQIRNIKTIRELFEQIKKQKDQSL